MLLMKPSAMMLVGPRQWWVITYAIWYLSVVLTPPSLQRLAWLYTLSSFQLWPIGYYIFSPYFDDVNAIIFLAFIPCFNEQLVEDRNINRLQDSFILCKAICSSLQLSQTTLVLFKCDLLEKKIKSGVSIKMSLPSFWDRPNDAASVTKCELSLSSGPCVYG